MSTRGTITVVRGKSRKMALITHDATLDTLTYYAKRAFELGETTPLRFIQRMNRLGDDDNIRDAQDTIARRESEWERVPVDAATRERELNYWNGIIEDIQTSRCRWLVVDRPVSWPFADLTFTVNLTTKTVEQDEL